MDQEEIPVEEERAETGDLDNIDYKEVSEMSEVTQESFPEGYMVSHGAGGAGAVLEDLVDFEKLKQQTQKKLVIMESE